MPENKVKHIDIKKALIWTLVVEAILWFLFVLVVLNLNKNHGNDFLFRYPKALWGNVLTLPLYFLLFRKRQTLADLTKKIPKRLISNFLQFESDTIFWRKWIFFRLAFFFLFVALAQPLFGTQKGMSLEKNSEVIIAMDISNSMNTLDMDPNLSRLEIAKRAATELINGLQGERLGVVIFAGNAFVQLPITRDYNTAKLFISEIETQMLSNQGTNFEAALDIGKEMFSEGDGGKCILLITDGENHEKIPEEKLKQLPEENIFLAVVGLGTEKGGLVYRDPKQPFLGYITDQKGKPVLSKVGKSLIKSLAQKAKGISMVTDNPFPNLSDLLTEINQLNKGDLRNLELEIKEAHYQFPLLMGILFWALFHVTDFSVKNRKKN